MQFFSDINSMLQHCGNQRLHVAIGTFDGLHKGHRQVLGSALAQAAAHAEKSVMLSFEPHPLKVLRPQAAPRPLLANLQHKLQLLQRMGFDYALILPFTHEFAALHANEFHAMLATLPLASVSVGYDWCYGAARSGNIDTLAEAAKHYNFELYISEQVDFEGQRISSTRIRAAVAKGQLGLAAAMLGRDFSLFGRVQDGRKLGRTLGFATANISPSSEQLPPYGVYVVRVQLGADCHYGVANLGLRPSIENPTPTPLLEVHIFDFCADIYHQELEVAFLHQLRKEQKFADLQQLQQQIARDVQQAKRYLTEHVR